MKKMFLSLFILACFIGMGFAQTEQPMTIVNAGQLSMAMIEEFTSSMTADSAMGTPIVAGNKTIIPLFEIQAGFGGGGGGPGMMMGAGTGGGVDILPYSVIIISDEGVQVVPVTNRVTFFEQLLNALPKLVPMVMEYVMPMISQ